jgi:hypothetical protein
MRKGERFASGQPRHWDLVSEVRASDRASADRVSGASLIPSRNPSYTGSGAGLGGASNFRSCDGHAPRPLSERASHSRSRACESLREKIAQPSAPAPTHRLIPRLIAAICQRYKFVRLLCAHMTAVQNHRPGTERQ